MSDNLPVKWDERLAEAAKEAASTERPALSAITFRAGIMSYMGQAVPGNSLDVIIISSAFEHAFYKDRFDANRPSSPVCFALSLDGENMQPHADSHDPKSDTTCDECELFKWNSDPNGGKGKACKEKRRFAVLPAAAVNDGIEKAEMATMSIPVTSVKHWRNYVNNVAASVARPPWGVITKITVTPNSKTQFEVKFDCVGLVSEDILGDVFKRIVRAQDVLLTPYEYQESAEPPAPKAGKKY